MKKNISRLCLSLSVGCFLAFSCNQSNQKISEIPEEFLNIKVSIDSTGGFVSTLTEPLDAGTGGLSVDKDGNILMGDFGAFLGDMADKGNKVFKITKEGKVSIWVSDFNGASGNGIDSEDNLFQSNIGGNFITKISSDGASESFTSSGLSSPVGIEIDENDNLYVCNCGNNSIRKISKNGESSQFVEGGFLNCPNGITMDDVGNFYVSNFYNGGVIKISADGTTSLLTAIPGENNGHLIYHNNHLYVVARSAHQIYKVSLAGELSLFAGTGQKGNKDGKTLEATFCYPNDIAISPDGKTFYINEVADTTSDGNLLNPTLIRTIQVRTEQDHSL